MRAPPSPLLQFNCALSLSHPLAEMQSHEQHGSKVNLSERLHYKIVEQEESHVYFKV